MKSLTEPLLELESYQSLLDEIRKGHTPVFATHIQYRTLTGPDLPEHLFR